MQVSRCVLLRLRRWIILEAQRTAARRTEEVRTRCALDQFAEFRTRTSQIDLKGRRYVAVSVELALLNRVRQPIHFGFSVVKGTEAYGVGRSQEIGKEVQRSLL
jgi:hypothetical protein